MEFFEVVASLVARFGDKQPKGGVIYKTPVTLVDGVLYIDSYGNGCTHNSKFNPYRQELMDKKRWNRPMPFPADLNVIFKALVAGGFDRIVLGHKSEFVPWMDCKYGIAKSILRLVKRLAPTATITINTSSDLIGHVDYIAELPKQTRVNMRINLSPKLEVAPKEEQDQYVRSNEPGAPSLLRRSNALERLDQAGIKACRVSIKFYAKPIKKIA